MRVTAACLGRLRARFPALDIEVIEAKMLAHHETHPYKSLDRALIGWCKIAEERGMDAKSKPHVSEWDLVPKGPAPNGNVAR